MELGNPIVLYVGLSLTLLLLLFLLLFRPKKVAYKSGKKIVKNSMLLADPLFKRKIIEYRIMSVLIAIACLAGVAVTSYMSARPYKKETVEEEKYNRDIILCMDVSSSVNELNEKLVEDLKTMVKQLKGERFGIVIFNSSPVILVPLTDDYEYICDELDELSDALDIYDYMANHDPYGFHNYTDEEVYLINFIQSGTLVDNELRGSSLIGDGLAATAYDFSSDESRTKLVIFSTDNDIQGEPLVTIDEAAAICKDKNVKVYGIGTKEMTSDNMESMKSAVLSTGGKFYLEEESGTIKQIVNDINNESASLIKSKTITYETDQVTTPFVILLVAISAFIIFTKVSKR